MNTKKINSVISQLYLFSSKVIDFKEPALIEDIECFEIKYNIHLPNEYKILLSVTNGLQLMGNIIYGIFNEQEKIYDLNKAYIFEHFECSNPMPSYLIPFCPDGFGNHYCFDSKTSKVVFWQSDYDYSHDKPEIVYNTLSDMIQEVFIDWTLEDTNYDGSDK